MSSSVLEVGGASGDDPIREAIDAARKDRDTLGGVVEVRVTGLPPGLGSYATKDDRLDARLAWTLIGTQAVKSVEIGEGFELARARGSAAHDEIFRDERGFYRETNHAGGLEAGITNGEEIVVRAAMKPLPTLMRPLRSVDLETHEPAQALVERSDVSAVEALAVIAEAVRRVRARAAPQGRSSAATRSETSWRRTARTSSGSTGRRRPGAPDARRHGRRRAPIRRPWTRPHPGWGPTIPPCAPWCGIEPSPGRRAEPWRDAPKACRTCADPQTADGTVRAIGRHVALIGFMGAGKTTVGHELARLVERPFVDVDVELERHHGVTIRELFAERGEAWFRNAEAELTCRLLDGHEPAVLALGGGAVDAAGDPRSARAACVHAAPRYRRRRGLAACRRVASPAAGQGRAGLSRAVPRRGARVPRGGRRRRRRYGRRPARLRPA